MFKAFSTTVRPACHVQSSPSIKFSRSIPTLHTRWKAFRVGSLAGGKRTPVSAITIATIAAHVWSEWFSYFKYIHCIVSHECTWSKSSQLNFKERSLTKHSSTPTSTNNRTLGRTLFKLEPLSDAVGASDSE